MAQDSSLPAFWDQRYVQGVTPWEGAAGDEQMRQFFAGLAPDSKVLLPGCGSAADVPWLMSAGMQVDAIDFSHEAVKRARQSLQGSAARLWQADFFTLPDDARYDAIFERAFLCALPPRLWGSYTHKVSQLLRPGGFLAGVFFLADKPKGPPYGTSLAELHQRLDPSFSLLTCQPVASAIPVFAGQEYWMVWQRLSD